MLSYLFVVLVAVLNIVSLTLFKTGVARVGGITINDITHPLAVLQKFATSPFLMAGIATSVCTTLLWLMTLTRLAASVAVPLMNSIFYVMLLVASVFFFGEHLSAIKLLAIALILVGVILIVRA